jgi:hypothetical protein
MKLTVNGVEVPIKDRLEILLQVDESGETMAEGMVLKVEGGPLTFESLPYEAAFTFLHYSILQFETNYVPKISYVYKHQGPIVLG